MKRKFKPYLDIRDEKQLKFILSRQNSLEENCYDFSTISEFTEKAFREEVKKIKNFYGYEPKAQDAEFVDELVYHMIVAQYYWTNDFTLMLTNLYGDESDLDIFSDFDPTLSEEIERISDDSNRLLYVDYVIFYINEIIDLNNFISKYYGEDFYKIREYTYDDIVGKKSDDVSEIIDKIRMIVFTIAN